MRETFDIGDYAQLALSETDAEHGRISQRLVFIGPAVAGSIVFHLFALGLFLTMHTERDTREPPRSVSINLVPAMPREPIAEQPVDPSATMERAAPVQSNPIAPAPDSTSSSAEQPEPQLAESEVDVPEVNVNQDTASSPAISGLLAIRQSIDQLVAEDSRQAWFNDCHYSDRDAGVRPCEEDVAPISERSLRNPVYQSLNRVRQQTRAQKSVRTIATQMGDIGANLSDADIPLAQREYLQQELEQGISVYSSKNNDSKQHVFRMNSNSAAAQQAERVLGDPWVLEQSRELERRNVHVP